jgi:hypothetical protein
MRDWPESSLETSLNWGTPLLSWSLPSMAMVMNLSGFKMALLRYSEEW